MKKLLLLTSVVCLCSIFPSLAQNYSNKGLIDIKEQADTRRLDWNKAFDDAVISKNFNALPAARKATESYLDAHLPALRRLFAEGDGRGLLTSVTNYLQIQKQFVKDVMVSAEAIKGNNPEEVDKINQKINDFAQKEKIFLIEINNAIATEPDDNPGADAPPVADEDGEEYEEMRGSVVEERTKSKRSGKLPHEKSSRKSKKDKGNDEDE